MNLKSLFQMTQQPPTPELNPVDKKANEVADLIAKETRAGTLDQLRPLLVALGLPANTAEKYLDAEDREKANNLVAVREAQIRYDLEIEKVERQRESLDALRRSKEDRPREEPDLSIGADDLDRIIANQPAREPAKPGASAVEVRAGIKVCDKLIEGLRSTKRKALNDYANQLK